MTNYTDYFGKGSGMIYVFVVFTAYMGKYV